MWCSAVYRYSIIICDGIAWTCIVILRHERHLKRQLHRVNPKVHEHSYKQSFFAVNNHFPGPVDKNEADSVIQWVVSYYKIIRKPQMFQLTLPTDPSVLYLRFSDGILQMHIVMFPQEHCDHSFQGFFFLPILVHPCDVYRSSLSTRPPGCRGLESGKKAAFTSRPLSVRAA